MSVTWPMVPMIATTLPWRKTGVTMATSKRCPAQIHGSFVVRMSPGWSVSTGNRARIALTARGSVRLKTGIARGECASELARGSRISQAKSWASPMIREKAVRQTVSQHSSTMLTSRLHMISSPIGSRSIRLMASASGSAARRTGCGRRRRRVGRCGAGAEHGPVDGLDDGVRVKVRVESRVLGGEGRLHGVQVLVPERAGRQRHRDVVDLTEEPHLGATRDGYVGGRDTGLEEQAAPVRLEVGQQRVHGVQVQLVEHAGQRVDELEADRRHEEAERGGRAGGR